MDWIFVVDDDESVRAATVDLLSSLGFNCAAYASAEEYLGSRHAAKTSCLVLDVNMPGIDGLQLQNRLKELDYSIPVIFITAFPEEGKREQAIRAGQSVICPNRTSKLNSSTAFD
jgi:FixJ family two-component response regulator